MIRRHFDSHLPWWIAGVAVGLVAPVLIHALMALSWPLVAKVVLCVVAILGVIATSFYAALFIRWLVAGQRFSLKRACRLLGGRGQAQWKIVLLVILFATFLATDSLSLVEASVSAAASQETGTERQGYFHSLPQIESFYSQPHNRWVHRLFPLPYLLAVLAVVVLLRKSESSIVHGVSLACLGTTACLTSQFLFIGLGIISTSFGILLSLIAGVLLATERFKVVTQGLEEVQLNANDCTSAERFRFRWDSLKFLTSAVLKGLIGLAAVLATGFTILWGLKWGIVETKWLAYRIFTGISGLLILVGWGIGLPFWRGFVTLCNHAGESS